MNDSGRVSGGSQNAIFAQNGGFSPIAHVPIELILVFFSFLEAKELVPMGLVCRSFKLLADNNSLWEALFMRDFPNKQLPEATQSKIQYQSRHRIKQNWKKGNYALKKIENCCSIFLIDGDKIITEGENDTIKIIDIHNESVCMQLEGHRGYD